MPVAADATPEGGSARLSLAWRPEIDGLRALAVLPILLFHAGYDWLPGGYIGVDIFFVISGYLISTIILREASAGTFTFGRFYRRRARRILPALLPVLVATLIGGHFLLLPDEYTMLAQTALAVLAFVPNILFWIESSTYFGLDSATQPLLHTWSLGIEEQCYLLLPPLLLLLVRGRKPVLLGAVVTVLAALSFTCNLAMLPVDARFSFYMLPARAWELLAGTLVALLAPRLRLRPLGAQALAAAGLALCIAPLFLLDEHSPFPGVNALYPVTGAALIILATGQPGTLVARVLAIAPAVAIGRISYSLYLWHWPFAVYAGLAWPDSPWTAPLVVALSIAAAALSYQLVEQRYRHRPPGAPRGRARYELAAMAACALAGAGVVLGAGGMPGRVPDAARLQAGQPATGDIGSGCEALPGGTTADQVLCHLGRADSAPTFALWGDSHANALAPALHRAAGNLGTAGVLLQGSGCRPLRGVYRPGRGACRAFNEAALAWLEANPGVRVVYLAGYWRVPLTGQGYDQGGFLILDDASDTRSVTANAAVFHRGLERSAAALADRHTVLVGDVPEVGSQFGKAVGNHRVRRAWLGKAPASESAYRQRDDRYRRLFAEITDSLPAGMTFLPLQPQLCDDGLCPLERDGRLLYGDGDHLSLHGSLQLAPLFTGHLRRALSSQGSAQRSAAAAASASST